MGQHVLKQQVFIGGGGNLSAENGILRVGISLLFTAVIAVHGMTKLMNKSGYRIIIIMPAHQNKGMDAINAPRVSSAAFALILQAVYPAAV